MIIQTLRRHSILSLTTTLVGVMLCAVPIAYAQTKDTTEIERQVGGTPAVDINVTKKCVLLLHSTLHSVLLTLPSPPLKAMSV